MRFYAPSHLTGIPVSGGDAAGDIRDGGDEAPDRVMLWSASRVDLANEAGFVRRGSDWLCEDETACQTRLPASRLTG
jgi:hypothetical protein